MTTQHTTEPHSPLSILLDPHNPRLSQVEEGQSQPSLLQTMLTRFKLEELAESIVATGYVPFDPLIAFRDGSDIYVLEGNRRIAALKLLLDPNLAPEKYRARWQQLQGELTEERRTTIASIDLAVFPDRNDVDLEAYIGFRHVTGVLQWPALEKASFIAHLVDRGWDYRTIAERLGSYPKTVERHYVGHSLVEQARSLALPGAEEMAGAFGVLMRSLQSPGVLAFLGISFPGDPSKSKSPIPDEKGSDFALFVKWTFGTNDIARILPDSRRLTDWGKILSSPEAVSYLKRTSSPSFDRAWFRSGGESESLTDSLLRAVDALEASIPLVPLHKDDPAIGRAVERCADFVALLLRDFPDTKKRLCGP
jgi:hypothetical protein